MATPKNTKTTVSTTKKTAGPAVDKVVETSTETQKSSVDWGNIMKGALTICVIVLLILGIAWLGKKVFAPERVADTTSTSSSTSSTSSSVSYTQEQDPCLYQAGKLGLPTDIATYVCNGKTGDVSLQLQSGTFVPFGTFTMDAESRVWILSDFTVPTVANYSFSYENAERNLLHAPFLVGSELGWKGQERVPFTICYNFEGECSLPDEIISQLFPTK